MVLAGCGSAASEDGGTATTAVTPAGAAGAISVASGNAVPLGISPAETKRLLGEPAVGLRRRSARHRCMLYDMVGQPPGVRLQFCFADGGLDVVATYVGEG